MADYRIHAMIDNLAIPRKRDLIPTNVMLSHFARQKDTSTYDVCNALKSDPYFRRIYANVRSRVLTLLRDDLIKISEKPPGPRGTIFYNLTASGVEYLLMDKDWLTEQDKNNNSAAHLTQLIKIHGDQLPFQFFAYPYFSRQTLENLQNPVIIRIIFSYLAQCIENISRKTDPPLASYSDLIWTSIQQLDAMIGYFSKNVSLRYAESCAFALADFAIERMPTPYDRLSINPKFSLDIDHMYEDLSLLAKDKNFLKLLARAKGRLDKCFKKFMKYQK
jgi:hypothetical protein